MTSTNDPKNGDTLPETIAAKAGLPHSENVERSLHEIRDGILGQSNASQSGSARDAYDDVKGTAASAARQASDEASSLADRARDKADELGGKARERFDDVRDRAAGAYDDARSWAADRYDTHRRNASDLADRGYERVHQGRAAVGDFAADNPLIVGVVGLAAGLLLGALLPRTRQEDDALGPWAAEARDQGLRYAREATVQGRQFVERALDPDNLQAAAKGETGGAGPYTGDDRTAHRL